MIGWLGVAVVAALLFYHRASMPVWFIALSLIMLSITKFSDATFSVVSLWFVVAALLLPTAVTPLRRRLLSSRILAIYKKLMPSMSDTEKEALEAGTVTWEGDLFAGAPDFKTLFSFKAPSLSQEEQAFLDRETNQLCSMLDEWDITHHRLDLPENVWRYIKENGFLGMIIPKTYGGLGFSASAQAAILMRIYGVSTSCATTVSVPNSLGPGELLLKYGTKDQKEYYLPRLAKGVDIPCFALTGPNAGSDAASIPDTGEVCYGEHEGEKVLGIRLNWDKRYITLAPVATVLGLAFKLFDPDALLGDNPSLGITCALIPVTTKGVTIGRRHFPLNTAFMNGPTQGKDVFIPMDYVIGGKDMVGQGWRMLMECLSAGRAISLPSAGTGGTQLASRATGAYARVRKQFNTAIANFEGIEEPLARIAANAYINNAGLAFGVASIDAGEKPAVASGILKYHCTERGRRVAMDAMDIHGGKGICLGPNNYLGRGYQNAPISITVEGANILTRCLIIFGQGAIRCHPYVLAELQSAQSGDLKAFDKAFFGHIGHFFSNIVRSFALSITDGLLSIQKKQGRLKRPLQLISRYSASMAFLADFSMVVLGADLKRREKISARLGDILSNLYLASAVVKQFHDDARPAEDWPIVQWSLEQLFYEIEQSIEGLVRNFPSRWSRFMLRVFAMPLGHRRKTPSDSLGHQLAQLLSTDNDARDRLSRYVYLKATPNNNVAKLDDAFRQLLLVEPLEKRVAQAVREGEITALTLLEQIDQAEALSVLSQSEAEQLRRAEKARQVVIAVDDFSFEELARVGQVEETKAKPKVHSATDKKGASVKAAS